MSRQRITDDTPMPFGDWKGLQMKEVPVEYLRALWEETVQYEPDHRLHEYIRRALKL